MSKLSTPLKVNSSFFASCMVLNESLNSAARSIRLAQGRYPMVVEGSLRDRSFFSAQMYSI